MLDRYSKIHNSKFTKRCHVMSVHKWWNQILSAPNLQWVIRCGEYCGGYLWWSAAQSSLSLTGDSWTKRTPVIGNTQAPPSWPSRDHMAACDWPVVRSRDPDLSCDWSRLSAVGASSVSVTTSEYSYSRNSSAGRIYHELLVFPLIFNSFVLLTVDWTRGH